MFLIQTLLIIKKDKNSDFVDLKKKIFVNPDEILHSINIKYKNRLRYKENFKSRKYAKLLRPNYPNNCLTVDITTLIDNITGLHQIQFNFKNNSKYQIEIKIVDKKKRVSRSLKNNNFGVSGPRLLLTNLAERTFRLLKRFQKMLLFLLLTRYFATELEQRIFLENDPKIECQVYNSTFTYDHCDQKFIKKVLHKNYPTSFTPIWATDNMSEVSTFWIANTSTFSKAMEDLFVGTKMSDCLVPCTSTRIKTVFLDEKLYGHTGKGASRIEITFSDSVDTYINEFPTFNISSFLAEIGGAIGLWLGLGVIQIMENIIRILLKANRFCFSKSS